MAKQDRNNVVTVRFTDKEIAMLDDMAKEAGKPRASTAHDVICAVLDDDAAAHAKTPARKRR